MVGNASETLRSHPFSRPWLQGARCGMKQKEESDRKAKGGKVGVHCLCWQRETESHKKAPDKLTEHWFKWFLFLEFMPLN